jgi:hypothetical protein
LEKLGRFSYTFAETNDEMNSKLGFYLRRKLGFRRRFTFLCGKVKQKNRESTAFSEKETS